MQTSDKMIPVEGHEDLVRDPNTGAILNINKDKIQQARERKRIQRLKIKEQHHMFFVCCANTCREFCLRKEDISDEQKYRKVQQCTKIVKQSL